MQDINAKIAQLEEEFKAALKAASEDYSRTVEKIQKEFQDKLNALQSTA